jgi:hypothetical protein
VLFPWKKIFLITVNKANEDEINSRNHRRGNICGTKKYLWIILA